MGKFYDALKRSGIGAVDSPASPSGNVVRMSAAKIEQSKSAPAEPERAQGSALFTDGELDPHLAEILVSNSPAAERFRMLYTRLRVTEKISQKPLKAIMVTSPEPLDGKSLITAGLAISIARGINESVVLVDCDLRAPTQHKRFGLHPKHGLSEYLTSGTQADYYLMPTCIQKLTLFPGGKRPPNPAELIQSAKMRQLVEGLRSRGDDQYILFDTPPDQVSAETTSLAHLMDGVLIVVRSGKTPKERIRETIESIGRERIIGIVFNASDERKRDYYYYHRYYGEKNG